MCLLASNRPFATDIPSKMMFNARLKSCDFHTPSNVVIGKKTYVNMTSNTNIPPFCSSFFDLLASSIAHYSCLALHESALGRGAVGRTKSDLSHGALPPARQPAAIHC